MDPPLNKRRSRISKIRSFLCSPHWNEVSEYAWHWWRPKRAVLEALADLGAELYRESGSPGYEVNNEYFRIGNRKIRVCTEDEYFVSLWGPKAVVETVHLKAVEKMRANSQAASTASSTNAR